MLPFSKPSQAFQAFISFPCNPNPPNPAFSLAPACYNGNWEGPMATIKQIEANRRNSQNSTGPKTPEGKEAVRFNALKSAIHAESLVIPGEDPEQLKELAEEFTQTWKPADSAERELVDQLIDDTWRLRRLRTAETQIWTRSIEVRRTSNDHCAHTEVGSAFTAQGESLARLQRVVASIKRHYRQTVFDLDRLQIARQKAAKVREAEAMEAFTESIEPKNEPVEQSQIGVVYRAGDPGTPIIVPPQEQRGHAFWKKLTA
jgi:hypothetical protein